MPTCQIGFEVARESSERRDGKTVKVYRSIVFTSRSKARKFHSYNPGSTLQAVELCDGRIRRRGKKRTF